MKHQLSPSRDRDAEMGIAILFLTPPAEAVPPDLR
mgnify:CR=1 FL=1